MKRSEIIFGLLRIPLDFLAALGALFVAYYLRANVFILPSFLKQPDLGSFPPLSEYTNLAFFGAGLFVLILAFFKLYPLKINATLSSEFRRIFLASLIWLMAAITYYFVIREFPFSRLVLFYAAALLFIFVSAGRLIIKIIQRLMLRAGIGKRHIIFVGENSITQELSLIFNKNYTGHVRGVLKNAQELEDFLTIHHTIDEVIQTRDDHEESEKIIALCRENHVGYQFVPDVLEMHRTNIEIAPIAGIPLISLRPTPLDGWGRVVKRIFDIGGSAFLLTILSPVFLLIAVAIKLDSAGTIFFRYLDDGELSKRVGQAGQLFHCLKFRTMQMGTHNLRYTDLANQNLRSGSPLVKIKNDPRVTRIGTILRRCSLDELPQLWNVLKGEMSLVGPRPHLPEEVARYKRHQKFVLTIKPGVTGLAQISGRSDLPFDEEVRLDTYYIENWSLLKDIRILLKTPFVLLKAYRE